MKKLKASVPLLYPSMFVLMVFTLFIPTGKYSAAQKDLPTNAQNNSVGPQVFTAGDKTLVAPVKPDIPASIASVKNLEKGLLKDLEVEVVNNSNKPIYCIGIDFSFPGIPKDEQGRVYGFTLFHGNTELLQIHSRASLQDTAIEKNQKQIIKVPESYWRGLEQYISKRGLSEATVRKIVVKVTEISFGDGTGFMGGMAFPVKQMSLNQPVLPKDSEIVSQRLVFSTSCFFFASLMAG